MVVGDLNFGGPGTGPDETKAELVVNADAMLAISVAAQRLKPVAGWRTQVAQHFRSVHHVELTPRDVCDARPATAFAAPEQCFSLPAFE